MNLTPATQDYPLWTNLPDDIDQILISICNTGSGSSQSYIAIYNQLRVIHTELAPTRRVELLKWVRLIHQQMNGKYSTEERRAFQKQLTILQELIHNDE